MMKKVFLFDDDPNWLEMFEADLRSASFDVVAFTSAGLLQAAIRDPHIGAPDAAVLDIRDGNSQIDVGFELSDLLLRRWRATPVFFLTSYTHGSSANIEA